MPFQSGEGYQMAAPLGKKRGLGAHSETPGYPPAWPTWGAEAGGLRSLPGPCTGADRET